MIPILQNRLDNHVANIFDLAFPEANPVSRMQILPLDAHESESGYHYKVDVPGLAQEDISMQVQNRILTIQGQRQDEQTVNKDGYYSRERWFGSFNRSIKLPPTADPTNVQAGLRNGVLTITVGKTEAAKPLKIEIKSD